MSAGVAFGIVGDALRNLHHSCRRGEGSCLFEDDPGLRLGWIESGVLPTLDAVRLTNYDGIMARRSSKRLALGGGGQWLELSLLVPAPCVESMADTLVALGSPGVVEEPSAQPRATSGGPPMARLIAAFPMEQVTERLLEEVRQALDACGLEHSAQATLSMQLIDGGAWAEQWKRFYRPFKIGQRLVIRPPWEPYTASADEVVLILNPGQAFGTGLHATTQLCLRCLETLSETRSGARLLDLGCGSGILSLASVLLGFAAAFGVDVDRLAVWVARVNARLNHLSKQVTFRTGSIEVVSERFEVVVANILLDPILAMLKPLHRVVVPGGTVIFSGILISEVSQLQRALSAQGWRITQQASQEEWAAIVCEEA
ncbi:MAG TPA: 50S ribosomal protein L11 methyltransferase [Alphaproteobacteria bacterium]|nr:50S ribosomal protein L11 methyltransferase [Alphaproteobacteria bacterium]